MRTMLVGRGRLVVEQAWQPPPPTEAREERPLTSGSVHLVYKRYLTARALADELCGSIFLDGRASFLLSVLRSVTSVRRAR